MKTKKKLTVFCAAVTAVAIICASTFFCGFGAQYNDVNYRTYVNLTENSAIPSLFKNDAVFASYKKYPPVISNGVEYVPLEIFYGLSNIKINFSDDGSNFYIQNKKSNKYISFSITDNYAVTEKNKVYEVSVPTFYGVYYVPLRVTCSAAGVGCNTYNDGENRIYAVKIYTAEGLSAQELVKMYAPSIYSPVTEDVAFTEKKNFDESSNNNSDVGGENNVDKPEVGGATEQPKKDSESILNVGAGNSTFLPNSYDKSENSETVGENGESGTQILPDEPSKTDDGKNTAEPPKKQDPQEEKIEPGTVMLFYTSQEFEKASETLRVLSEQGVKATFFVTKDDILNYPDVLRQIYASGHTLGVTFNESAQELYAEGALERCVGEAEDALYEVLKTKTRIAYLPKADGLYDEDVTQKRIEELGLRAVSENFDAQTDKLKPSAAKRRISASLSNIKKTVGSSEAYIKMTHSESANSVVVAIANFARKHSELKTALFDETVK